MRRRSAERRAQRALLCVLLIAPCGTAQSERGPERPAPKPDVVGTEELRALTKKLDDARTPLLKREQLLRDFLAAAKKRKLTNDARKKLLVRLATFELASRKARRAIAHFREAESLCKTDELYVRARCRLGIGQAHELLGEQSEAIERYTEVRRLRGTPFARRAAEALERLRSKKRVTIGRALRLPAGTRTLSGRRVRASSAGPTLLFCLPPLLRGASPRAPRVLERLGADLSVRILISVPRRDARRWAALAKQRGGKRPWIVLADRVDLALGIASLPSCFLLDQSARVVEMNPSARRLREVFGKRR